MIANCEYGASKYRRGTDFIQICLIVGTLPGVLSGLISVSGRCRLNAARILIAGCTGLAAEVNSFCRWHLLVYNA